QQPPRPLLHAHRGGAKAARQRAAGVRAHGSRHPARAGRRGLKRAGWRMKIDNEDWRLANLLRRFWRIAYLLPQGRHQRDVGEEMRFHREMVARGPEAQNAARVMGNLTLASEDARGVWIAPWLEGVWQDVSYAGRALWREPGFALLAIGALT